jgi:hypothetical protein
MELVIRRLLIGNLASLCAKFATMLGHAIVQAVSRLPLTAETRVCAQGTPYGICGAQNGIGTGSSPSSLVLPCQYHFIAVLCSSFVYRLGEDIGSVSGRSCADAVPPQQYNDSSGTVSFVVYLTTLSAQEYMDCIG